MQKPGFIASLARLAAGSLFSLTGLLLYVRSGHEGFGPALFFSFLLALGIRWLGLGLLGLARPLPPRKVTYGSAAALMVVLSLAGPSISTAYNKANEPRCWANVKDAKEQVTWTEEYTRKVPMPFRRPQYLSRQCEAICQDGLREKNFYKIRYQADSAFVKEPEKYDDQARKAISAAWRRLIDDGLNTLKPTQLADPRMTAAFRDVLKSVEDNPSRHLVLHFEAQGSLGPIPQDKQFFAGLTPKVAKLPVLKVGEAYSPEAHARRSGEVMTAIQNSFDAVWPKGMIEMKPVPPEASPDDIHFWVQAKVRRIPGFYTNSEGDTITSLIYKCEVAWRFRIVVQGQEVGSFDFHSEPAKHVAYRTKESDPEWAPYSIVMDSAADNFARLIVGRLGLVPPAGRESYNFR